MLIRICRVADGTGRLRETIELPVDSLDQQADLIDRVFAFAFDVLELQAIELRVRPRVVAIAGGDNHSLALGADGTVWAWFNIEGAPSPGYTPEIHRSSPSPP
jgi:hypothetical protein